MTGAPSYEPLSTAAPSFDPGVGPSTFEPMAQMAPNYDTYFAFRGTLDFLGFLVQ